MVSFDFNKNIEATNMILTRLKEGKDIQNILQVSDLLIKWGYVRVWGNQIKELIQAVLDLLKALLGKYLLILYYNRNILGWTLVAGL